MTEGIININKEQKMTSHDVVGRVRRIFQMRRVGHTGTLDPMATGVLPVCLGRAARIMEYIEPDLKTYRCVMSLGKEYDTQDIWGTLMKESTEEEVNQVTEDQVERVLKSFEGVQDQTPPMYSAVKVDGKRLYEYAREGKEVKVKSRQVYIGDVNLEEVQLNRGFDSRIQFTMTCSKGTFVRTVCQETGRKLGVGAAMSELTRLQSGIFTIENAVTLSELQDMDEVEREQKLVSIDRPLAPHFGRLVLSPQDGMKLMHGLRIPVKRAEIEKEPPYAKEAFLLPLPEKYSIGYLAYSDLSGVKEEAQPGLSFLGVVYYMDEDETFKPGKIFYPQPQ
ncbi:MAG: tRNA pseudouridine(55) synthase TruB [Eubacterium sp.]|jgi:tRNA pseudouridine55 synthase|nr:tRNA pseudouridine(55) synthase TruB [Eubacterium sp.]MCH4046187.1 tRNA pseudouridine(55) synthase TruB [Eubacterium sp.]MCH4079282.1 tRNA pseudouridine(55) synthase TruB [Eubacterium sp.]MCH4110506.1 tRNA pseudouridine(55) synthase TruB [Eubacterium sp.]MCI1307876.1 tRNA pseudouridine(55) synthase TruB [Eubacterium sp.]